MRKAGLRMRVGLATRRGGALLAAAAAVVAVLVAAPGAQAASGANSAVVLVSGFTTITPFTTPDPSCAGKEGPTWDPPSGIPAALRAAGFSVFTAPVKQATGQPATPCAPGTLAPPLGDYINSNGDVNENGAALGNFLEFLKTEYGIKKVDLVAHSAGGLWSRSAITQQKNFPGVTVDSLTTLGTPHTGSFEADIAEGLNDGKCTQGEPIVKAVCLALRSTAQLIMNQLGPVAIKELSSDYLSTWNPEQRIGSCPVTGIAGTYFDLPLPPSQLSDYYNPSDVLVGEASALGRASTSIWGTNIPGAGIPNFIDGGSYPVVHSATFSWLTPANLLDTPAISAAVVAALNAQTPSAKPCTSAASPPTLTNGNATITVPLHGYAVPRHGRLPKPRRSDLILYRAPGHIFCGTKELRSFPFLGHRKVRLTHPVCAKRLRVKGNGKDLLIRTGGKASIQIKGNAVSVKLAGVHARRLRLQFEGGGRFVPVSLDASGEGTLPAGTGPSSVRVLVSPEHGVPLSGGATVSR